MDPVTISMAVGAVCKSLAFLKKGGDALSKEMTGKTMWQNIKGTFGEKVADKAKEVSKKAFEKTAKAIAPDLVKKAQSAFESFRPADDFEALPLAAVTPGSSLTVATAKADVAAHVSLFTSMGLPEMPDELKEAPDVKRALHGILKVLCVMDVKLDEGAMCSPESCWANMVLLSNALLSFKQDLNIAISIQVYNKLSSSSASAGVFTQAAHSSWNSQQARQRRAGDAYQLHYHAAKDGKFAEILRLLTPENAEFARGLSNWANPHSGWTILHQAAFYGHGETTKAILAHNTVGQAPGKDGKYPCDAAREMGHKMLGSDLERHMLHAWAGTYPTLYEEAKCGEFEKVTYLFARNGGKFVAGAAQWAKPSSGWTLLHQAAFFGKASLCEQMVCAAGEKAAQLVAKDNTAPADAATQGGHSELAGKLKRLFH